MNGIVALILFLFTSGAPFLSMFLLEKANKKDASGQYHKYRKALNITGGVLLGVWLIVLAVIFGLLLSRSAITKSVIDEAKTLIK